MDDPHDLPDSLTAGPLLLPLVSTPDGPMLSSANPLTEPLALVVNASFGGVLDGLRSRLEKDESMWRHGMYVLNRSEVQGPPPEQAVMAWRTLSGHYPSSDFYLVGTEFVTNSLLVPRAVLLEVLDRLDALRGSGRQESATPR